MEKEKGDLLRYVNLFGYHPTYGLGSKPIGSVTYKPQPTPARHPLYENQEALW
jgi:DNA polymerase-3 subunit epsilon